MPILLILGHGVNDKQSINQFHLLKYIKTILFYGTL